MNFTVLSHLLINQSQKGKIENYLHGSGTPVTGHGLQ